mmetsp:Transcript_30170/g.53450  ORF Transcript_30170/g.53450 Transcript_30170/m.53450 type:complete len:120 (-) Transcript_30170:1198-1557(-)
MFTRCLRGFASRRDHLKTLELKSEADLETIKKAYYALAKKYHPDIDPGQSARFKAIKEAYEALANSEPPPLDEDFIHRNMRRQQPPPPKDAPPLYNPYKKSKPRNDDERLTGFEKGFWM